MKKISFEVQKTNQKFQEVRFFMVAARVFYLLQNKRKEYLSNNVFNVRTINKVQP